MSQSTSIILTLDQSEDVVINELQIAYELECISCNDENEQLLNNELLDSIEIVLKYFMVPSDYNEWKKKVDIQRKG